MRFPGGLGAGRRSVGSHERAATSVWPADSLLATWTEVHEMHYPNRPPLLFTVETDRGVASLFQGGGYRVFKNYASSRTRDAHVEEGHLSDQQLDRAARKAAVSVLRGIGFARQAADFDLNEVWELLLGKAPLVPGGPVNPRGLATMPRFFCTREIEPSLAYAKHLTVDPGRKQAPCFLPATKKDALALSVTRTWSCACVVGTSFPCCYHAWLEREAELARRFGDPSGALPSLLPAFPSVDGRVVDKEKVLQIETK